MYSRYTPNENGGFDRLPIRPSRPQPPKRPPPPPPGPHRPPHRPPPPPFGPPWPPMPPGRPPVPPPPWPGRPGLGGVSALLGRLFPGNLQRGDLLMLAILYLVLSEEDSTLPILAVVLYLLLK